MAEMEDVLVIQSLKRREEEEADCRKAARKIFGEARSGCVGGKDAERSNCTGQGKYFHCFLTSQRYQALTAPDSCAPHAFGDWSQ